MTLLPSSFYGERCYQTCLYELGSGRELIANYLCGNLQIENIHGCWDTRMQCKKWFLKLHWQQTSYRGREKNNHKVSAHYRQLNSWMKWGGSGWFEWTRN